MGARGMVADRHVSVGVMLLLVAVLALPAVATSADAQGVPGSSVALVSVNQAGSDSGKGVSTEGRVSADGSVVVFASYADDLTPRDSNGVADVFVRDLETGRTSMISRNASGSNGGNGDSRDARVSANGEIVTFTSEATNLTGDNDGNGSLDVFVHDRRTGITRLVSRADSGSRTGDDESTFPRISADGSRVVFHSYATDLTSTVTPNGRLNAYAYDVASRQVELVSERSSGNGSGDDYSGYPDVSADGSIVAFSSLATDLVDDTPPGTSVDVFVRDLRTDTTEAVPVEPGATGNVGFSPQPALSADGTVVAFHSDGKGLTSTPDTNGIADAFVSDLDAGTTTLVSVGMDGRAAGSDEIFPPQLSRDGSTVVFWSEASDVTPTDPGGADVFAYDVATGDIDRVSAPASAGSVGDAYLGDVSANGRRIAFSSNNAGMTSEDDGNGVSDVFLHDRATGATTLLSRSVWGDGTGNRFAETPAMSADGGVVVFGSWATDLVEDDTNGGNDNPDVFVTPALGVPAPPVTRLSGSDRYATAATVALSEFASADVDTVFLATGADFPDALTGGPLAAHLGAPILLAGVDELPGVTADALRTLAPKRVVALGGTAVLSQAVVDRAAAVAGARADRLSGRDRHATAATIARELAASAGAPGTVFLATGRNFPDAMAASPVTDGAPIVLVEPTSLPSTTSAVLGDLRPQRVVALGGQGAIAQAVLDAAGQAAGGATTDRLGGQTRYDTALQIAGLAGSTDTVFLAVGTNFPDALTAAPAAAAVGAPIVLTDPTVLPEAVRSWLQARPGVDHVVILGGTGAVSSDIEYELESLLG